MKNMNQKRWGHCSVYLRSKIYVLGGFCHSDIPDEPPHTLSSVEVATLTQNYWEIVSPMNTCRSQMACSSINDQYIYIFGGISDYKVLNSIEKYDAVTDTWISLYFKIPMPLAKHAVVSINNKQILIIGGMSADFEPSNKVW